MTGSRGPSGEAPSQRSPSRVETEQSLFRGPTEGDDGWSTPASYSPLPPVVGDYAVMHRLGGGSMAELYLAHKIAKFGVIHHAVIKQVKRSRPDYRHLQEMLLDEARATASFDHPNVVKLYDVGETDHGVFLALEYVNGTDLRRVNAELRQRKEALPFELAAFIVGEVLRGLHHAHIAVGLDGQPLELVHRDVNPSNVLISRSGHVKLADFGVVRMRERLQQATEPGLVKGKYAYLAPEYIAGEPCSVQTDIYAAGIMLFELLSGRECFNGNTAYEVMWKIVNKGVPMYRLSREGVPDDLQRVVQRATSMVPERRYETAQDMANALEAWLMRSGRHATAWVLSVFFSRHDLCPPEIEASSSTRPRAQSARAPSPKPTMPQFSAPERELEGPSPSVHSPPEGLRSASEPPAPPRKAPAPSEIEVPILTPADDRSALPSFAVPPPLNVPARPMPSPLPTPLPTAMEQIALEPNQALPDRATPPSLNAPLIDDLKTLPTVPPVTQDGIRRVRPDSTESETPAERPATLADWRTTHEGKLEDVLAADVLKQITEDQRTGIVEFRCGLIWKRVIIVDGRPTGITSNMGMELIGEHLVKARIISRSDLDRALKGSEREGRPLTVTLLEQGALDRGTLEVELGNNLAARLSEVLEWRWGTFEFKAQEIDAPEILPKLDLDALLESSKRGRHDPSGGFELLLDADTPEQRLSEALRVARSISKSGGKGRVDRPWRSSPK